MMGVIYTYGLFYALFFSKASYHFTPLFNLRRLIFGLNPIWLAALDYANPIIWWECYFLIYVFVIHPHFFRNITRA
jgi:hypothetical protein